MWYSRVNVNPEKRGLILGPACPSSFCNLFFVTFLWKKILKVFWNAACRPRNRGTKGLSCHALSFFGSLVSVCNWTLVWLRNRSITERADYYFLGGDLLLSVDFFVSLKTNRKINEKNRTEKRNKVTFWKIFWDLTDKLLCVLCVFLFPLFLICSSCLFLCLHSCKTIHCCDTKDIGRS